MSHVDFEDRHQDTGHNSCFLFLFLAMLCGWSIILYTEYYASYVINLLCTLLNMTLLVLCLVISSLFHNLATQLTASDNQDH